MTQRVNPLELLPQTGADTPMGRLLRRFWQPVATSASIGRGEARELRVMGEDLTLYRGETGTPWLVAGRCAHRKSALHTGWVEGDQIRCMYHGWRYDGSGLCNEIPAEPAPRSEPVRITAYPLHEYCGLVFAWMGPLPAPAFELPRKHVLEEPGRHLVIMEQVWDFNWFQQIENSMDAVHVSFVHAWGGLGRFGEQITTAIPQLSYAETSAGIRQTATRSATNVRVSDWTFPNNNHIIAPGHKASDPWTHISVWAVPIDDHNTRRFTLYAYAPGLSEREKEETSRLGRGFDPRQHKEELFVRHRMPQVDEAAHITAQDYVALLGQGVIADRLGENLSPSDAGIVFLRRIFFRELEAIQRGAPTKQWARLEEAPTLPAPAATA